MPAERHDKELRMFEEGKASTEMKATDFKMRKRTVEELKKLGDTPQEIAKVIGCKDQLVRHWLDEECVPSHIYMNRLYEVGCDILYIITGVKQHGN